MRTLERRRTSARASTRSSALHEGREHYRQRAWASAHDALSRADRTAPLAAGDLELLATSAYLVGRDDEYLRVLDRAHRAHLDAGDGLRAARCAFWLGLRLTLRGEPGRASGWLGRAHRLLAREGRDCVEQGYLLLAAVNQQTGAGDLVAAHDAAARAADIGDRFREPDLSACARHLQGRVRMAQGRVEEGLALLDEVMVAVVAGELSPLVTGLVCSVIDGCHEVCALGRASEWTSALARWCDEQPEMVAFTGVCGVHRAEIMELHGAAATAWAYEHGVFAR